MAETEPKTTSNAGNLYLIFLGLLLLLMGAGFMFVMWLSYVRANTTRDWPRVTCNMISSARFAEERTPGKMEYQWRGQYEYSIDGKQYMADRYELRGAKWTTKVEKVDEIVETFPAGAEATCFVDPANHAYSILKHDSRGAGYSIWFPGLFAVGGVGMIVGALRKWKKPCPQ